MTPIVMPGLVPGIHVLLSEATPEQKGVDGRDKPGHDGDGSELDVIGCAAFDRA